ncbi:MAG: exodeoxyribonuclease VII large subunit [Peptococcaceae bacterium]|jgi:exodeoxyribonuclease VII large subunit|nr:exodeoxyribonuclease VII large subunit [Peptococcaceae bacterium]
MPKIWSVTELVREVGLVMEERAEFRNCWISGELSNFKNHRPSGHWYFTIKDPTASLRGIMFRSRAERVRFTPLDGMKILARGNIRMYERDGNVQFYAEDMQPSGLGELYLAFEQLKQKLWAEGLFAEEQKKPIPRVPRRVGIVTSPTGAAVRDILQVMARRHPRISWILAPAAVQGEAAPREIARAIANLNRLGGIDVLIVGRGGGSLEELWAFNTEEVARAIQASEIPVISAVGHETDVTIADYAADLRAPTPSAAAELAVPLLRDLQAEIDQQLAQLSATMRRHLEHKRQSLAYWSARAPLQDPRWRIDRNRQQLENLGERLQENLTRFITDKNGILHILAAKLHLLSPLAVLGRGYSLTYAPDGKLVRSEGQIHIADTVKVRLHDGGLTCKVLAKEKNDEKSGTGVSNRDDL